MTDDATILVAADGPLTTVTLNRPGKLNALTPAMVDELHRALDGIDQPLLCQPTGEGRELRLRPAFFGPARRTASDQQDETWRQAKVVHRGVQPIKLRAGDALDAGDGELFGHAVERMHAAPGRIAVGVGASARRAAPFRAPAGTHQLEVEARAVVGLQVVDAREPAVAQATAQCQDLADAPQAGPPARPHRVGETAAPAEVDIRGGRQHRDRSPSGAASRCAHAGTRPKAA